MAFEPIDPQLIGDNQAEIQIRTRRLFMYSDAAINAGIKVDRIFVNHTAAKQCLEAFDRVYQLSRTITSPPGIRLVGPTGSGKSTLIRYFRSSLPSDGLLDENTRTLYLRVQERPAVGRFISTMLQLIHYPFASVNGQNEYAKKKILQDALRDKGTKMLFLDEAHHLCQIRPYARNDKVSTNATDFIRELIDEVPLSAVLAGDKILDRLPEVDAHLAARTQVRLALADFDANQVWNGIVSAILKHDLGIKMDKLLVDPELVRLHAASEGNLRRLKWLVSEVVMVATEAKALEVGIDHMSVAFQRVHGPDSMRTNPFRK